METNTKTSVKKLSRIEQHLFAYMIEKILMLEEGEFFHFNGVKVTRLGEKYNYMLVITYHKQKKFHIEPDVAAMIALDFLEKGGVENDNH